MWSLAYFGLGVIVLSVLWRLDSIPEVQHERGLIPFLLDLFFSILVWPIIPGCLLAVWYLNRCDAKESDADV